MYNSTEDLFSELEDLTYALENCSDREEIEELTLERDDIIATLIDFGYTREDLEN